MSKQRLTVTVDPHLVRAGNDAVEDGSVDSLSAWVNLALAERAAKDRRLAALADAVSAYEAQFGSITSEELAAQARADRVAARVVRTVRGSAVKARRPRRSGSA
jgi:Arc/MetJ-type ribon-helix-helix transcriptional regulator